MLSNQEEIKVLALEIVNYMLKHLLIILVQSISRTIRKVSIFQKGNSLFSNKKDLRLILRNSKFGKSNLKKTKNKFRSKNKLEREQ